MFFSSYWIGYTFRMVNIYVYVCECSSTSSKQRRMWENDGYIYYLVYRFFVSLLLISCNDGSHKAQIHQRLNTVLCVRSYFLLCRTPNAQQQTLDIVVLFQFTQVYLTTKVDDVFLLLFHS